MGKNCIYTIAIDKNQYYSIFIKSIEDYAKNIGVDLIIYDKETYIKQPKLNIFNLYDLFETYDRVLYLDADILVRPDSPDVFKIFDNKEIFYAYDEGSVLRSNKEIQSVCTYFKYGNENWNKKNDNYIYFNAGVILASKIHRDIFKPIINLYDLFLKNQLNWIITDQTYLNFIVQKNQVPFQDMGYRFNHLRSYGWNNTLDSFFVHYAGFNKEMAFEQVSIEKKITSLNNNSPIDFSNKKKVYFNPIPDLDSYLGHYKFSFNDLDREIILDDSKYLYIHGIFYSITSENEIETARKKRDPLFINKYINVEKKDGNLYICIYGNWHRLNFIHFSYFKLESLDASILFEKNKKGEIESFKLFKEHVSVYKKINKIHYRFLMFLRILSSIFHKYRLKLKHLKKRLI